MNPLQKIAFVGCYPPRRCGIATFTADVRASVATATPALECVVAAVTDRGRSHFYPPEVCVEIMDDDPASFRRAARALGSCDVISLQHEFGIFGGEAGDHVIDLLRATDLPVVTTLHTVLTHPDAAQRRVMTELAERCAQLVVMARRGETILRETYQIDPAKVTVIPHGIPVTSFPGDPSAKSRLDLDGRVVLLTFGLLGPGKGIEHAIQALPCIVHREPNVSYVVLGATHPHLVAREGERYRESLERLAADCGVQEHVVFHNRFVSPDELADFIAATDIYLSPYPNEAQITSGTLAQAFGSGTPIVSTPYWHARELLADGAGVLVPPAAIGEAVLALLADPERREKLRLRGFLAGREMTWPSVGLQYLNCFRRAREEKQRTHLRELDRRWPGYQSFPKVVGLGT
jgi:glycosyltransferase involved in cell wall biosynthesis